MSKEKFSTLLQSKYILPLTISALGLFLILVGIGSMVASDNKKTGVLIEQAASTEASPSASKGILVDVGGAVEHPGVYSLEVGSRIQEALIAAGGFAGNADREYISKNINLAAKVSDGGKVYIPRIGESTTGTTGITSTTGGNVAGVVSGLVNINSASQAELETLSGVGAVTAKKIIDDRPYSTIEELLTKKVVGQSVFDKIKEKITSY